MLKYLLIMLCVGLYVSAETIQAAEWKDAICVDTKRKREIPYRVYFPKNMQGQYPVVLFSHGLGGSRETAAYLGKHLADHGYISFHIQHHGSDERVWAGKKTQANIMNSLAESIKKPQNAIDRMHDVPAFIDYLEKLDDQQLKPHLDLTKIGMAGHSYGSKTTLIAAGGKIGRLKMSFKEDRIKAGVLLSPNKPERQRGSYESYYSDIEIPLFHITGTKDGGELPHQKDMSPTDRCIPYEQITTQAQYLLVLRDADHALFSGRRLGTGAEKKFDKEYLGLIKIGIAAFFDAHLRDQQQRQEYLHKEYAQKCVGHRYQWK